MTYLEALLNVGGVFWLAAFGLAVLGTFIKVLSKDGEGSRAAAKVVVAMLVITAVTMVVGGGVWLEENRQFEENSHE